MKIKKSKRKANSEKLELKTKSYSTVGNPLVGIGIMILRNNKILMLKRKGSHGSGEWNLPGGHLEFGETISNCVIREVFEETGLKIQVFQPVTTWFGHFNNLPLLSIDYLCTCNSNRVSLSHEHSDFRWLSMDQLRKDKSIYFTSTLGFKLSDFELAWQTYQMNNNL